jgi:hypothetical protein|tara:strand:+ start:1454 stop:2014 length:561 start_codon:yes stop_codon:yes gene_type:complete
MAIKTMAKNTGTGQYNAGWHELTISKAVDGKWGDKRTIDLNFEGYPDQMRHRVFEASNKTTGEEFKIANLFRFANAGIISVLQDPTGKNPVIQYDDDASNLVETRVNVFFVKEASKTDGKEYSRTFDLVPVAQEGEHLTWTFDDVERLKKGVEKQYAKRTETTTNGVGTATLDTTTTVTGDAEVPF